LKKKLLKIFLGFVVFSIALFFLYFNNLGLVDSITVSYYKQLKAELKQKGFKSKLLVVSTKRFKWHNQLQVKYSGAASKSRHLSGDAIDFIVFDVNKDGSANHKDVEIVYSILDEKIIRGKGGIGTYKTEPSFFYRQMIHIDARGYRARWTE
jgi:uncharacterized protein YcbK (DUF882 family)